MKSIEGRVGDAADDDDDIISGVMNQCVSFMEQALTIIRLVRKLLI